MAETTIEWTHGANGEPGFSFNPWYGCTKISDGCQGCYAEGWAKRSGLVKWGVGEPRRRSSASYWKQPIRWNAKAKASGTRPRVFCASLADVFDNEVPKEWRRDLFQLIAETSNLDWLLLTKRIGNAKRMMDEIAWNPSGLGPCTEWQPMPNIWLGATVVNQEEADRDIPKLLAVPARVRFLSMEPLLGPVDLMRIDLDGHSEIYPLRGTTGCEDGDGNPAPDIPRIDWVIVGGESGPNARPMHPDWARSLRDQCAAAGVPFLFKQWGEWTPGENVERQRGTVDTAFLFDDAWQIHPLNLATDEGHIDDQPDLYRVGKKAAGRLLDGVTHDAFPEVRCAT